MDWNKEEGLEVDSLTDEKHPKKFIWKLQNDEIENFEEKRLLDSEYKKYYMNYRGIVLNENSGG